jgi:hypothetical protein
MMIGREAHDRVEQRFILQSIFKEGIPDEAGTAGIQEIMAKIDRISVVGIIEAYILRKMGRTRVAGRVKKKKPDTVRSCAQRSKSRRAALG